MLNNVKFIETIFKLLSSNKKFPNYQAERRIDIFINLFLEDILNSYFGTSTIKFVMPEFPLKKDKNNRSTKLDYLCYDDFNKQVYFVELKTDNSSYSEAQGLSYASYQTWQKCLDDFLLISKASSANKKYSCALNRLVEFGLIDKEAGSHKIQVVYISPVAYNVSNIVFITFQTLHKMSTKQYQEEWKLFCNYLLQLEDPVEKMEIQVNSSNEIDCHYWKLKGDQIQQHYKKLDIISVGRAGGINGKLIKEDKQTGKWKSYEYEVSNCKPKNINWMTIEDFLKDLENI